MAIDQHTIERPDGSVNALNDRAILGTQQVAILSQKGAVASVTMLEGGIYAGGTMPVLSITGAGSGATLVPNMKAIIATIATAFGTGNYFPGDIVSLGGTGTPTKLKILKTYVESATIVSGGTGGTNGTQNVVGTTGNGQTKFQATVTVSGGAITAINSIFVAGSYTTNPTNPAVEPVSGVSLVGATLNIKMGILSVEIYDAGSLTLTLASPVAQVATTGSATGATFNMSYGIDSVTVSAGGSNYDSTSAFAVDGGGATGNLVLSTADSVVTVPVSFAGLPANYSVLVNPDQNCGWYCDQSSKTTSGFNVSLVPQVGKTIAAGTIDVCVLG